MVHSGDKVGSLRDIPAAGALPTRVAFLLIEDFALMSYASVIEPFRAANRLSGQPLYEWYHMSVDGQPVRPSTGITMHVDGAIDGNLEIDMILVCAGANPATFDHRPTFAALRKLSARGITIGGVSGGAFLLARAGLLDGYRCTIHWEHEPAFLETFPNLDFVRGLFVIDRRRITCAGGTAG
ncbi:MAG: AraC family transcriptional regulator, partial [Hyphomicrobiales bacterium]